MIKWLQWVAVVLSLATGAAQAATGIVPVQGQLEDSTGVPLEGSIDITFTLYRDAEASQPVWTDTLSVTFELGAFTARLGSSAPLELALFRDEQMLHLGIRVDGDDEMQPIPLATVPWAAYAHHADDAAQVGGLSRTGIEALIPATSDIETLARGVCYDSEGELHSTLDGRYLPGTYLPDWSAIQNRPTGLDDGDHDTIYSSGAGLLLDGTEFSVRQDVVEQWARNVCYDSEADLTDVLDPHYSYTVGEGLLRAGTQIDLDTARVPVAGSYRSLVRVQSEGGASTLGDASVHVNRQLVLSTDQSYGLVVVDRATGAVVQQQTYDVHGGAAENDLLAADLALYSADHIVIINTFDEPNVNRLDDGLAEQIYRCGGSPEVFGSAGFAHQAAYLLVGICDMGVGTGVELYSGDSVGDSTAFLDYSFELVDGQLLR